MNPSCAGVLQLTTFLALGSLSLQAQAQPTSSSPDGAVRFEAHLLVGYYRDLGAGFRADIPIVPSGLIDAVEDDLAVVLGVDLLWYYRGHTGFGATPLVALQWNFYLDPHWSVFPELGIAFLIADDNDRPIESIAAPTAAVGARYHFSVRNALLLRLGWPGGLQVGITF